MAGEKGILFLAMHAEQEKRLGLAKRQPRKKVPLAIRPVSSSPTASGQGEVVLLASDHRHEGFSGDVSDAAGCRYPIPGG
jgi:hypothetical protein